AAAWLISACPGLSRLVPPRQDHPKERPMPFIPAPSASSGPPGATIPDRLLTPLRRRLLDGLHAGRSLLDPAARLGLLPGGVFPALLPLGAAGVVARDGSGFRLATRSLWE